LSSFRVQYVAVLVPVVVVLFAQHRWGVAIVAAAALIANLAVIVPLYISKPTAPDGVDRLLVMSFNMNFNNQDIDLVLEAVRNSSADVVFLHEGTPVIEEAIGGADLPYEMLSGRRKGEKFGTIALYPEGSVADLVDFQIRGVVVTLLLGGGDVEVMGMHPLSPVSAERSAGRDAQLEAAAEWATAQTNPVAVTGDFNASTWSYGFSLISGPLENSQLGFGVEPSWPVGFLIVGVPIDHLVHSGELTVVDRHLGPPLGSDHYPLFVTLARAAGE